MFSRFWEWFQNLDEDAKIWFGVIGTILGVVTLVALVIVPIARIIYALVDWALGQCH